MMLVNKLYSNNKDCHRYAYEVASLDSNMYSKRTHCAHFFLTNNHFKICTPVIFCWFRRSWNTEKM